MSPIANFQAAGWSDRPAGNLDHDDSALGPRSLPVRSRVAAHRSRLTRELAAGTEPGSSREHALRAAQLTSNHNRKLLVRSLRRTVNDAHRPQINRARMIIIDRRQVLDAEDAINALIARLSYAEPVRAQGMAIVERLLGNADKSPLYNTAEPGALRRQVLVATQSLDTTPGADGEFAIAAWEVTHEHDAEQPDTCNMHRIGLLGRPARELRSAAVQLA